MNFKTMTLLIPLNKIYKCSLEEIGNEQNFNILISYLIRNNNVKLAIYSARKVLPLFEKQYLRDNRPRKAIEAAEECLINPCKETRQRAKYAYAASASFVSSYYDVNAASAASAYAAFAASSAAYAVIYAIDAAVNANNDIKKELESEIFNYGMSLLKSQTIEDLLKDGRLNKLDYLEIRYNETEKEKAT